MKQKHIIEIKPVNGQYVYIPSNNLNEQQRPSDKIIKNFYADNKSKFKNIPNRTVTYFIFDLKPSEQDKSLIMQEMTELISDKMVFNKRTKNEEIDLGFLNTNDLKTFVTQNGDNSYSLDKITLAELDEIKLQRRVDNGIVYPYFESSFCKMARIMDVNSDSVSIVYLERELYASDQTLNEIYSEVFDFMDSNKKILDANELSKQVNIRPRSVELEKMDQTVPGLGMVREIVRWAFSDETNLNETKFFDLQDKYIVAYVSNISENEYKNLAEVQDDIITSIKKKSISSAVSDLITNSNFNTIQDLANQFNVSVNVVKQLRLNSDVFGESAYNPGAVGAFFSEDVNVVSKPFINDDGVFVFLKEVDGNVNYPSSFDSYKNIIQRNYHSEVDKLLLELLKDESIITDNRFNFY